MDKHNIKSKINQEITGGKNTLMERSKQTKMRYDKNYITQKTSGMWTNNINKFKSVTINMIE
jgi:hypothetical protein